MSYPRNIFRGIVVILNSEIQYQQCRKIAGKLWAGNYPRNPVWGFLDGIAWEPKMEFLMGYQTYDFVS